jgi:biotin synthase
MPTTAPISSPQASAYYQPETLAKLQAWYAQPLLQLVFQAATVHRAHHDPNRIQLATLANIKSGRCPEDCHYCPQSSRYNTGVDVWDLPTPQELEPQIVTAKANGSSRFCMGAAWRTPPSQRHFEQVLDLINTVTRHDMEACVTLGMITPDQARQLKEAGLTAYNHNIDTSPEHYTKVITTRTIDDRLTTLKAVGEADLQVCCGGILGMGETEGDRLKLLATLMALPTLPESVPINCLVPVEGTPLADQTPVEPLALVRMVAVTRLALPKAKVRLSAGRLSLSTEAQALCFLAGANSMFTGEVLLTTPNPGTSHDAELLAQLGLQPV